MGILLGIVAGLCWGANDYFIAIATRRVRVLPALLAFHVLAVAALAAVALISGASMGMSATQALVLVLAGVLGWAGYLTYFTSLQIGPISLVSPVISGYSAVTVVLAVLVLSERLDPAQTAATVVALVGVVVAGVDREAIRTTGRFVGLGIGLAAITMLLIGGFVFALAVYADDLGWLVPILLARAVSCVLLAGTVALRPSERMPWPGVRTGALLALVGLLDTAGYATFNVGVQHARAGLVAAASAPYAVVPIITGVLLLGERPSWTQRVGTAAVIAGVAALGAVS